MLPICRALSLAALVLVTDGCGGASSTQVRGPDGRDDWYTIKCRRSQGNCFEEAGEVCPNGYHVADQQGHVGAYVYANQGNVVGGTRFDGELFIRCKTAREADPYGVGGPARAE